MQFPENLQYTKDHEWIKIEGDHAVVGITDFAQSELGDIIFVDINTLNQEVKASDVFGTVEAVKVVSDLFMPITGTITEVNSIINTDPASVNQDPYGKGWLVKVKISSSADKASLLSVADYKALIGK